MINSVVLAGRAGRDPELKQFNSGSQVAELTMAVKRNKDETDWFDIKIWGNSAEIAMKYLRKGQLFSVVGRLQQEKWQEEGRNRSKITIQANTLNLFPKGKDEEQTTQEPKSNSKATSDEDLDDIFGSGDEIPF